MYGYELIYSKRKTISIIISSDNKITVRCPLGLPRERAEKFLNEKKNWIEKAILKNEKKMALNADIISFESIYSGGKKYPLYLGERTKKFTENGVFIKSVKDIKKLYIDNFAEGFILRVNEISRRTGLRYAGINFKNYKSRWGCCDVKNNVTFNYKIFMLPERLQYYVIIHELCHTVRHNHSEKFWQLVASFLPEYKELKKELRGYDFLTTLY